MPLWEKVKKFFSKPPEEPDLLPEDNISLEAGFLADARKKLQLFDEFVTAAEAKIEQLTEEIEKYEKEEAAFTFLLQQSSKESWNEKNLLLKIERGKVHTANLKRRIEIYNQNIRVYLNLMSKIEEMQAMRLGGLSEEKIQNIWLDFKERTEQYQNLLHTDEAAREPHSFLTEKLSSSLESLKPERAQEKPPERPQLDQVLNPSVEPELE